MKKIYIYLLFSYMGFAQQIPQFTQYILNPFIVNPAYAGTTNHFDIKASYRKQWLGIQDSPATMYLTFHGHIGKDHPQNAKRTRNAKTSHQGIGATILKDQTGPLSTLRINATYCYDFKISKTLRMSFGVSGGVKQFSTDLTNVKLNDGTNNVSIPLTNLQSFTPDLSAGIYLYNERFFAGLSAQNLLFNSIKGSIYGFDMSKKNYTNYYAQHLFMQLGYVFSIDKLWHIIPSTLIKYSINTPTPSFDFNTKVKYNNQFWAGLNLRTSDAIALYVGTLVAQKFELSVSYDYGITHIAGYSSGSLEFLVGYRIYPTQKVKSPSDYW